MEVLVVCLVATYTTRLWPRIFTLEHTYWQIGIEPVYMLSALDYRLSLDEIPIDWFYKISNELTEWYVQ